MGNVYDTGVVNKLLFTTPCLVCATRPESPRNFHGCFSMKSYYRGSYPVPKTASIRRDTSYPGASVEYSDRCRKYRYLRHRCRKYLIYDTTARSRHTRRFGQTLPRVFWYGVQLSLKLSCTRNGLVLDEIRRILVHQQHNQTGVVNKQKKALFTTPVSQITYLRQRGTLSLIHI